MRIKVQCVLKVGSPAQIHLTEQFVIGGFLYEVVYVAFYGEREAEHFIPALYYPLQALLDITNVGLGLGQTKRRMSITSIM